MYKVQITYLLSKALVSASKKHFKIHLRILLPRLHCWRVRTSTFPLSKKQMPVCERVPASSRISSDLMAMPPCPAAGVGWMGRWGDDEAQGPRCSGPWGFSMAHRHRQGSENTPGLWLKPHTFTRLPLQLGQQVQLTVYLNCQLPGEPQKPEFCI